MQHPTDLFQSSTFRPSSLFGGSIFPTSTGTPLPSSTPFPTAAQFEARFGALGSNENSNNSPKFGFSPTNLFASSSPFNLQHVISFSRPFLHVHGKDEGEVNAQLKKICQTKVELKLMHYDEATKELHLVFVEHFAFTVGFGYLVVWAPSIKEIEQKCLSSLPNGYYLDRMEFVEKNSCIALFKK
jgi:hypothetical protein